MASLNLNLKTGSSYRRTNNATVQAGEVAGEEVKRLTHFSKDISVRARK